jgi:hypothetical protein
MRHVSALRTAMLCSHRGSVLASKDVKRPHSPCCDRFCAQVTWQRSRQTAVKRFSSFRQVTFSVASLMRPLASGFQG